MRRFVAIIGFLVASIGCETVERPRDDLVAKSSGVVVASVEMRLPKRYLHFGAQDADSVFMYRLLGNEAPYTPGALFWSDEVVDGHAIFLAVPPGRYAVAGAVVRIERTTSTGMTPVGGGVSIGSSSTTVTTVTGLFPGDLVRSLVVDVEAAGVAVAGEVDLDLGSLESMDDAQRYAYRVVAPRHASGEAIRWLSSDFHYRASARRIDQSASKIAEIGEDVRSELSEAGWAWRSPLGPSEVAALEFTVAAPSPTASSNEPRAGSAPALALRIVEDSSSDTSDVYLEQLRQTITAELASRGFDVDKEPSDLTLEVAVRELTPGSGLTTVRKEPARFRYTVTLSLPSGEVMNRSDGEETLGDKTYSLRDARKLTDSATLDELIARAVDDIVKDAKILGHSPTESAALWLEKPELRIVLDDRVGSEYSTAGIADFETLLAEEMRTAGYRLDSSGSALTLDIRILSYHPGSRAKRLIGFGYGAAKLEYDSTLRDASGKVLGHISGKKRYTGLEITDSPESKSERELRWDMAEHCADQIGRYVRTLPAPPPNDIAVGP
jgi:hypothetical protein